MTLGEAHKQAVDKIGFDQGARGFHERIIKQYLALMEAKGFVLAPKPIETKQRRECGALGG